MNDLGSRQSAFQPKPRAGDSRLGFSRRIGMSVADQQLNMRIGLNCGPLDLPPVDDLRDAFVTLASVGPETRLGLLPCSESAWAFHGSRIGERAGEVIRVAPAQTRNALEWLFANQIRGLPIQFARAGDHLALLADHRLIDAAMALNIHEALIDTARGKPLSSMFAKISRRPLSVAAWQTFVRHPSAIVGFVQHMRQRRSPQSSRETPLSKHVLVEAQENAAAPGAEMHHWSTSMMDREVCQLQATMAKKTFKDLRLLLGRKVSLSTGLLLLTVAALDQDDVDVASRGLILIDLRRYLPKGVTTFANFITAVRIPLTEPVAMAEPISRWMREVLEVGRPLVSLVVNEARGKLLSFRRSPSEPESAPSDEPVTVSVSSLGVLRSIERLPWRKNAKKEIEIVGDAVDRNSIGFITFVSGGKLMLSVSFQPERIPVDTMERVLQRMAATPLDVFAEAALPR